MTNKKRPENNTIFQVNNTIIQINNTIFKRNNTICNTLCEETIQTSKLPNHHLKTNQLSCIYLRSIISKFAGKTPPSSFSFKRGNSTPLDQVCHFLSFYYDDTFFSTSTKCANREVDCLNLYEKLWLITLSII